MEIYKVHNYTIAKVEVLKETDVYYNLKRREQAFGYLKRIEKAKANKTPEAAIREAMDSCLAIKKSLESRLEKIKFEISVLEALKNTEEIG